MNREELRLESTRRQRNRKSIGGPPAPRTVSFVPEHLPFCDESPLLAQAWDMYFTAPEIEIIEDLSELGYDGGTTTKKGLSYAEEDDDAESDPALN